MQARRLSKVRDTAPAKRWALRESERLQGTIAVKIGTKWFTVLADSTAMVEVKESDLLARCTAGYGVAKKSLTP
jgi:hypothetical protein